ncbi:hypothetical protein LEMLEM_LOCUS14119 [Lemmus lemmus]
MNAGHRNICQLRKKKTPVPCCGLNQTCLQELKGLPQARLNSKQWRNSYSKISASSWAAVAHAFDSSTQERGRGRRIFEFKTR